MHLKHKEVIKVICLWSCAVLKDKDLTLAASQVWLLLCHMCISRGQGGERLCPSSVFWPVNL